MKSIREYIEEGFRNGCVKNAAELSKKIGVTEAAVSRWRSGERTPTDEEAVRLAQLLRKEPGELLAECGAARAKSPETRKAWEKIAARMAACSITAIAIIMPMSHSEKAQGKEDAATFYFQKLKDLFISKACRIVPCL